MWSSELAVGCVVSALAGSVSCSGRPALDCPAPPCEQPGRCFDGLDNDGDGWTDALDPDCATGTDELGYGTSTCNDGIDNDGDGRIDAADPQCTQGSSDEVLGDGVCADRCRLGATDGDLTCALWDADAHVFIDELDQSRLHNRARVYTSVLRDKLMPQGGIFQTLFSSTDLETPVGYDGVRDSPIWTGTYLAAEALRYRVTGAPDAMDQIERSLAVLHRWWTISGDRGYLARFAAPDSSPTLNLFESRPEEVHTAVVDGSPWRWRGDISRDQYQGAFLGYSLAYDVVQDESLRALIRNDVVNTIEQLMSHETRPLTVTINGVPLTLDLGLEGVIYTDDEGPSGIDVTVSPFSFTDVGLVTFWPNPATQLRQIPGLGFLPDMPFAGQAIQLGGMFRVALQVTENVPSFAARRAAIQAYYDAHFDEWANIGAKYGVGGDNCGSAYHGKNIAFTPAFNWLRLETDPARKQRLRDTVLRDALWNTVADHKNVWFAFIYAAEAEPSSAVSAVAAAHAAQLAEFPDAPNLERGRDLRDSYPLDTNCTDEPMSTIAIDVGDRVPSVFMWERHPWKLVGPNNPRFVFPGHDFLIAYWMGRRFGFLDEDTPNTCLVWH